jgi:hypothetical protein
LKEQDVTVSKTALGVQVMKDRSMGLSPQQRSALILCDGKRSLEEVLRMTSGVGVSTQDMQKLLEMGLIETGSGGGAQQAPVAAPVTAPVTAPAPVSAPAPMPRASVPAALADSIPQSGVDFQQALDGAITLCSNLGFKGFGLNMALTGVDNIEKLQKLAPEIRRAAGDAKYKPLHALIFGKPL